MDINFHHYNSKYKVSGAKILNVYSSLLLHKHHQMHLLVLKLLHIGFSKFLLHLQSFVSYHTRKSIYSVNALLLDAHASTYTKFSMLLSILIPPIDPHKFMVHALILSLVYLCI